MKPSHHADHHNDEDDPSFFGRHHRVHENNDDQSYYSYYSEGSMGLAKRQNKQLSLMTYVPMVDTQNSSHDHRTGTPNDLVTDVPRADSHSSRHRRSDARKKRPDDELVTDIGKTESRSSRHRRTTARHMSAVHEDDETVASDMLLNKADAAHVYRPVPRKHSLQGNAKASIMKQPTSTLDTDKIASAVKEVAKEASKSTKSPRNTRKSRALAYASKGWKRQNLSVSTCPEKEEDTKKDSTVTENTQTENERLTESIPNPSTSNQKPPSSSFRTLSASTPKDPVDHSPGNSNNPAPYSPRENLYSPGDHDGTSSVRSRRRQRLARMRRDERDEALVDNELQERKDYQGHDYIENEGGHDFHRNAGGSVTGYRSTFFPDESADEAALRVPTDAASPSHETRGYVDRIRNRYGSKTPSNSHSAGYPKDEASVYSGDSAQSSHFLNQEVSSITRKSSWNRRNQGDKEPYKPVVLSPNNQSINTRALTPVTEEHTFSRATSDDSIAGTLHLTGCVRAHQVNVARFASGTESTCHGYTTTVTSFVTRVWDSCKAMNGYEQNTDATHTHLEQIAKQSVTTIYRSGLNGSRKIPESFFHPNALLGQHSEREDDTVTTAPGDSRSIIDTEETRFMGMGLKNGTDMFTAISTEFRNFAESTLEGTEALTEAAMGAHQHDSDKALEAKAKRDSVVNDVKQLFDSMQKYYGPYDVDVEEDNSMKNRRIELVEPDQVKSEGLTKDSENIPCDEPTSPSSVSSVSSSGRRRDILIELQKRRMKNNVKNHDDESVSKTSSPRQTAMETEQLRNIYRRFQASIDHPQGEEETIDTTQDKQSKTLVAPDATTNAPLTVAEEPVMDIRDDSIIDGSYRAELSDARETSVVWSCDSIDRSLCTPTLMGVQKTVQDTPELQSREEPSESQKDKLQTTNLQAQIDKQVAEKNADPPSDEDSFIRLDRPSGSLIDLVDTEQDEEESAAEAPGGQPQPSDEPPSPREVSQTANSPRELDEIMASFTNKLKPDGCEKVVDTPATTSEEPVEENAGPNIMNDPVQRNALSGTAHSRGSQFDAICAPDWEDKQEDAEETASLLHQDSSSTKYEDTRQDISSISINETMDDSIISQSGHTNDQSFDETINSSGEPEPCVDDVSLTVSEYQVLYQIDEEEDINEDEISYSGESDEQEAYARGVGPGNQLPFVPESDHHVKPTSFLVRFLTRLIKLVTVTAVLGYLAIVDPHVESLLQGLVDKMQSSKNLSLVVESIREQQARLQAMSPLSAMTASLDVQSTMPSQEEQIQHKKKDTVTETVLVPEEPSSLVVSPVPQVAKQAPLVEDEKLSKESLESLFKTRPIQKFGDIKALKSQVREDDFREAWVKELQEALSETSS